MEVIHFQIFRINIKPNEKLVEGKAAFLAQKDTSKTTEKKLITLLKKYGFEPVQNSKDKIVELSTQAAVELIFYSFNSNALIRNSDYISQKLQLPYDKIAKIFKKQTKTTLEKYIIALKIQKAKDMIISAEFNVSEIAFMLGYSSVHYLSNQLNKIAHENFNTIYSMRPGVINSFILLSGG